MSDLPDPTSSNPEPPQPSRGSTFSSIRAQLAASEATNIVRNVPLYDVHPVECNAELVHDALTQFTYALLIPRIRRHAAVPAGQLSQFTVDCARSIATHCIIHLGEQVKNKLQHFGLERIAYQMYDNYRFTASEQLPQILNELIETFGVFVVKGTHYQRILYYANLPVTTNRQFNVPNAKWITSSTEFATAMQTFSSARDIPLSYVNNRSTSTDPWWLCDMHYNVDDVPEQQAGINNTVVDLSVAQREGDDRAKMTVYSPFHESLTSDITYIGRGLFPTEAFQSIATTLVSRPAWFTHEPILSDLPNIENDDENGLARVSNIKMPRYRDKIKTYSIPDIENIFTEMEDNFYGIVRPMRDQETQSTSTLTTSKKRKVPSQFCDMPDIYEEHNLLAHGKPYQRVRMYYDHSSLDDLNRGSFQSTVIASIVRNE